jgi:FkbM family methyltransferase
VLLPIGRTSASLNATALQAAQAAYEEQLELLDSDCVTRCPNRAELRQQTAQLLESSFVELAANLRPEISVEVGAHEASFSERLKARVPSVRALAFEANPYVYAHFAPRLHQCEIDYRHAAICDRDGVAQFSIPTLLPTGAECPRLNVISSLRHWVNISEYEETMVPALRIDTVLPAPPDRLVAWIDAEGAQGEILTGGGMFFSHVAALYIEVEYVTRWRGQLSYESLVEQLRQHSLVPVMRDNIARGQRNEVYIRADDDTMRIVMPTVEAYVLAVRELVTSTG